jgi:membrane-bound lytic murein transglycosylase D
VAKHFETVSPREKNQNAYLGYELYDDPTDLGFLSAKPEEQCQTLFSPPATVELVQEEEVPVQGLFEKSKEQSSTHLWKPTRLFKLDQLNNHGPRKNVPPPSGKFDLWCRIRDGYKLEVEENSYIQRAMDQYVNSPSYFENISLKAKPYLYHIVTEVEQRGMPLEIALLPAIESGFEPFALSPKSAAGLWQIIPNTGRDYGLTQTTWYDGRLDIIASTEAALDYLERLHDLFEGDWLRALAAYNYGEGNVRRAIRRNEAQGKPTDFWSLDLPRETRWYVPKLLALAKVIASPQEYGIRLPSIPDSPYLKQVTLSGPISLSLAAQLAELSTTDIFRLNPAYSQGVTTTDGPQTLTLPLHKAHLFKQRLAKMPLPQRWPPLTYNDKGGLVNVHLTTGKTLTAPPSVSSPANIQMTMTKTQRHLVSPNESLENIARRYGTSVTYLRLLNRLQSDLLKVGTLLTVPDSPTGYVTPSAASPTVWQNDQSGQMTVRK